MCVFILSFLFHGTPPNNLITGAFVILGDLYVPETQSWNLSGVHLVKQQDFWYTLGMTTV